jgi:hypothetical protein
MTAAPRTLLEFNPTGLGRPAERVFPHTLPRRSHAERLAEGVGFEQSNE